MNKKVNVKGMVQPHLQTPKGYDGIRSLEAMAADAGIPPDKIIRLNGNENSYGPSPKVAKALASYGNYNRYPDPQQREIKKALAVYTGSPEERIVAGNGSDEMIDLVMRLFVGPGDNIIEPVPTFGMYRFSARLIPAEVISVKRDKNFELDVEAIALAKNKKTKIIFIAHPNNPTGNAPSESQIRALLEMGVIVVVDEAYYEYCGQSFIGLLDEYPNLIIFRTFSKWAGLAGLRVGMGVMDPEIAKLMMTIKPPYNMNVAAEVALKASLEDKELLMSRITPVIKERERMFDLIKKIPGVTPIPSQANFMMVRLPKGRGVEIYQSLARKGVFVRYYQDGDMADCLRVSVGQGWETDGFVKALREAVAGK